MAPSVRDMDFIGCDNFTKWQQEYTVVHGHYRARVEHLFGRLWHWGVVPNIWSGNGTTLHKSIHILLHLTQCCIRREVRGPPLSPLAPCAHVWADIHEVCALCCMKKASLSGCNDCHLHYCAAVLSTHRYGGELVAQAE